MPIWPGTQQTLTWQIKNALTGALLDPPAVAIILNPPKALPIIKADTITTPLVLTRLSSGLYAYAADIPLNSDGDWHVRWEAYEVDSSQQQLRDTAGNLIFLASEEFAFQVVLSTVHRT